MRRIIPFILLYILCLTIQARPHVNIKPMPDLEVSSGEGLAAFYYGTHNGMTIIAGGANFPDAPCAEGGAKHFYDEIRVLSPDGSWKIIGQLPHAVANGASVSTAEGIACVGGMGADGLHDDAFLLTEDGVRPLPKLPFGIKEHALAHANERLYLVGGVKEDGANLSVLMLNMKDQASGWQTVAEMPGGSRLQALSCVQTGAWGTNLYILSGYTVAQDATGNDGQDIIARTDGLSLNLSTMEWKELADIPEGMTLTGGSCSTIGYSHIICMGGVNKEVFEARVNDQHPTSEYFLHDPAWYKFNDRIWIYHTITNSWYSLYQSPSLALAGAGLISLPDHKFLLVNGECKPGIRSAKVNELSITQERSFGWVNWCVLVVYLLGMLLLGYVFMKRESGADDFFRGGGRIPWWAAGISIYATMLSALTYMGIPAKAYATNWTYYPMLVTILLVSFPVIKYYLPYFRRLSITSAYEYLEMRFNAATRLMASGLFIVFMVARMALVLYLPSLALTAVTGIDIQLCIVLMGLVTIVYCTMGGVEAVVWGDVIQGFILVGGAFFLAGWLMLHTEGGVEGYFRIAADEHKMRLFEWSMDYRSVTFWVAIVGGMANNIISYTSDQTVIQRYLTTKDERSAAQSILLNGVMCVCVSIVFYFIGTGLYTFFQTHPEELDITMEKGDAILPYFMMAEMPQGVAGLLIAAIFAATMSTISSNINSVSTAFSVDFWKRLRTEVSDRTMLRVARWSCVVSGVVGVIIALLMAQWNILSLIDYFNTILGLLTGGLGGLFFIGIFMPKVGGKAALVGFTSGTAFVFWMSYCTDVNLFLYGASGIAVSVIVAWLCSCILKEDIRKIEFK